MKQKIIKEEDIEGIMELINSSDKENQYMGLTILENCNMPVSLPWLIILIKKMSVGIRKELQQSKATPKLWEYLVQTINFNDTIHKFNSQIVFDYLQKCKNNKEALDYLERDFEKYLKEQMIDWGYSFLKKYKLTLTKL